MFNWDTTVVSHRLKTFALIHAAALIEGNGGALKYDAPFFNFTWMIVGAVRVAMSGSVGFAMVLLFFASFLNFY
jgi:hypothetical protein